MSDAVGCGFPSNTEYPGLEEEKATYPQAEDHFLSPHRAQVWLERNSVGWWKVMWMLGLAWRDSSSQSQVGQLNLRETKIK